MDANAVGQLLKTFIVDEILHGDAAELQDDTPLLEWGVIDSIAMVSLLAFIQKQFGVRIEDDAVVPRNFRSIAAMSHLVRGKLGESE